ncbi:MAG: polysaccharide deacetylase family protein [Flavobacteriaceae bacterium]|nr:polysaccharide deacetylase family protein [Flavobacteriaceae bacterium]
MLLIYTHKITPRLTFTFNQVFKRILQVPVKYTTKLDEFVAFNGAKITYTKAPLGNEFFIKSHDLLFEQGFSDIEINVSLWDDVSCFFKSGNKSVLPYDIFAASFYLMSRYEEYLPHVKDQFERFPATESLGFKHQFLEDPVVDIWAYKLKALLQEKFKNLEFGTRQFSAISTVDIDSAYAYNHKNIIRTVGGFLSDFFLLRFKNLWHRSLVVFNFRKDPFDQFQKILNLQKTYKVPAIFFFLVGDYTTYDKNISHNNIKFRSLMKSVSDYAQVGLHPSFFTMKNEETLKKEKKRLEEILNTPVQKSRHHYLRIDLPETYQKLIDLEIFEDYTMGYAQHCGFRAGTCTPFYFYDLDFEIQTPLKVFPFAFMDGTLKDYLFLSNRKVSLKIGNLIKKVKAVDGTFISLFHNETLSDTGRWQGWSKIYLNMLKAVSQKETSNL